MSLGKHIILDLYECDPQILDDLDGCKYTLEFAANMVGCKILNTYFHQFSPQGITGIVAVSESHFSIHTWPERSYAAVDIFCCKDNLDAAIDSMIIAFKSKKFQIKEIQRGEEDYLS